MIFLMRFWRDARGATAIEYAIIALMVSIMIIAGAAVIGAKLVTPFNTVGGAVG